LGTNKTELDRLCFQHTVWKPVTDRFFDRLGVGSGWRCLDVGAGPGFVAKDLHARVGEQGEITVLEPSPYYLNWFRSETARLGWKNVRFIHGTVEQSTLPHDQFDLIFVRWVMSFVTDLEQFLAPLFAALKPGGIVAAQDYYYEGLSLFPHGGAFDKMPDAVREYYKRGGGDAYVAGRLPGIFRKYGLSLIDFTPVCLAGGPRSDIMEWAHRFFTVHTQSMVDKGIVSQVEGDAMVADWLVHRGNPDALFFSPLVVNVAGRRGDQT